MPAMLYVRWTEEHRAHVPRTGHEGRSYTNPIFLIASRYEAVRPARRRIEANGRTRGARGLRWRHPGCASLTRATLALPQLGEEPLLLVTQLRYSYPVQHPSSFVGCARVRTQMKNACMMPAFFVFRVGAGIDQLPGLKPIVRRVVTGASSGSKRHRRTAFNASRSNTRAGVARTTRALVTEPSVPTVISTSTSPWVPERSASGG